MKKNSELRDLFFSRTKDFLDLFLTKQMKRSSETVKAYRISLKSFYRFVTGERGLNAMQFQFTDCTYDFVLDYMLYLAEKKKLANETINQRLAALRSYMKYVADEDIELMQVYMAVMKVPLRKTEKNQRPVIEKDGLRVFLSTPDNSKIGIRDCTILVLLFDSAIRVSELISITLADLTLDIQHPTILIHGKGQKTRMISMSSNCAAHMQKYMKLYHKAGDAGTMPLFYTVIHGEINRMSVRNIERIVKKYGDLAREKCPDIPDSMYPHLLRRSRATGMYRDDIPLEMISKILGHSQIETTKIYAIPSVEQMREAFEKGAYGMSDNTPRLWEGKEEEILRCFGLE